MKILLSEFLEQHHLSIRQAAIMTGVPRSTIGDIVTGQVCPTKSVRDSGQRTTF